MEMLMAFAIMAGMSLALMAALRMGQRSWKTQDAQTAVSAQLRQGMLSMTREIAESRAGWLSIPADGVWYPNLTFRVPQDLNGDGTVWDAAGVLEWSLPVTYSVGGVDGNQVQRVQQGAAVRVVAYGVTALQFRRQPATPLMVEIALTVQKGLTTSGFANQANLNSRVRLRN